MAFFCLRFFRSFHFFTFSVFLFLRAVSRFFKFSDRGNSSLIALYVCVVVVMSVFAAVRTVRQRGLFSATAALLRPSMLTSTRRSFHSTPQRDIPPAVILWGGIILKKIAVFEIAKHYGIPRLYRYRWLSCPCPFAAFFRFRCIK